MRVLFSKNNYKELGTPAVFEAGESTLPKGRILVEANGDVSCIKAGIATWNDGESNEEDIVRRAIKAACVYCSEHGIGRLAIDTPSLIALSYNFSYVYSVVCDLADEVDAERDSARVFNNGNFEIIFSTIKVEPVRPVRGFPMLNIFARNVVSIQQRYACDILDKFREHMSRPKEMSFGQYLINLIKSKIGNKLSEGYKAAGISRYLFSKLTNFKNPHNPSKPTVAAFAIALRLSFSEAEELYNAAGYHINEDEPTDRALAFFISHGVYDIDEVNWCLYESGYPVFSGSTRAGGLDEERESEEYASPDKD